MLLHQEFLTQFEIDIIEAEYAIGTPLLLAPLIKWFGHHAVFTLPIFCLGLSYILMYKSLIHLGYNGLGVLLFLMFLPLLFITRTIMSEMPSLLLVSISLFLLIKNENTQRHYWVIFLLGGISVLFRETNALIFGPILLYIFFQNSTNKKVIHSVIFLVGLSTRLIANYIVYQNAFHLKHGYPFSISYIPNNIILYSTILLVLIPGGLLLIARYSGKYDKLFLTIIGIFTATHLCYGYDATDYSGYKMGLILNGRFYIPLLPIFAICLGYFLTTLKPNFKVWITRLIYIGAVVIGVGSQYYLHHITSNHRQVADAISTYKDQVLIFDHTVHSNIVRYINPYLGNVNKSLDISRIADSNVIDQLFDKTDQAYIVTSERNETRDKKSRNNDINKYIDTTLYRMNQDTILYTGDGGIITVSQIKPIR